MNNVTLKQLQKIAQTIYDKNGFNILILDVKGICSMADYIIIAEGNVDRHVKALSDHIQDLLEEEGGSPFHIDGYHDAEWIVLDYSDFIVHLFTPEMREKYALEELWKKGKVVDVKIKIHKKGSRNDEKDYNG